MASVGQVPRRVRRLLLVSAATVAVPAFQGCSGGDQPAPSVENALPSQSAPIARFGASEWLERYDVASSGFVLGSVDAPVQVIEFSDFACPHCATHALQNFAELAREFVGSGLVGWRYIPIVLNPSHGATKATYGAMCVAEQSTEAFWDVRHLLYLTQTRWMAAVEPDEVLRELLDELTMGSPGLSGSDERAIDPEAFERCVRDGEPAAALWRAESLRTEMRVRGTPTFIVDGFGFLGAPPLDQFRELFGEAVEAAQGR